MTRRQRGYFDSDYGYEDNPLTLLATLGLPALVAAAGGIYLLLRKKPAPVNGKKVTPSIPPPAKGTYRAEGTWAELQDWQARWFGSQGVSMTAADIEAAISYFVGLNKVPTESEVASYLSGKGFTYTLDIIQQIIQQVTIRLHPPTPVLPEPTSDEMDACVAWHISTNSGTPTLTSVQVYFSPPVPGGGPGTLTRNITQAILAEIIRRYQNAVNGGKFPTAADIKEAIAYFCQVMIIDREGAEFEAISNWFKNRGLNPRDSDIQQVIVGRKNCAQIRPIPPIIPPVKPPVTEPGWCSLTSGFQAGPPPTSKAACEAVGGTWFSSGGKVMPPRQIGPPIPVKPPGDVVPPPGYVTGTGTKTGTTGAGVFSTAAVPKTYKL